MNKLTKPYAKINVYGYWFICHFRDLDVNTSDLEPGSFVVEAVELTDEQFEALPEFEGW